MQQENLNPEIEEKLLTLQRYQEKQMKTETPSKPDYGISNNSLDYEDTQNSRRRKSPTAKKRIVQHADDDDWVLDTPKKRSARAQNHPIEKRPTIMTASTLKETIHPKLENVSIKANQQYPKPQSSQEKHHETPVKKVPNKQQVRTRNKTFKTNFIKIKGSKSRLENNNCK